MPDILELPVAASSGSSTFYQNPVDANWKTRFNDFTQGDGNNFWGELNLLGIASTGASIAETALVSGEEDRFGIATISCGSTYGISMGYASEARFGGAQHRFGAGLKLVAVPDATDDALFWFGFSMDTNSIGTYMSYIGIDRSVNATNFIAVTRKAGTQTATDTGVAFDTDWHTFEIIVNGGNTSHAFYIDGTLVATNTTNLPDASLAPTVGTSNVAGAANSFKIDWIYHAFKPTAARGTITTWLT